MQVVELFSYRGFLYVFKHIHRFDFVYTRFNWPVFADTNTIDYLFDSCDMSYQHFHVYRCSLTI